MGYVLQVVVILMIHFAVLANGQVCRKDLLLIVDTSYTINKDNFDRQVKPFLENLVTDKTLNVGRETTQVSLMVFSEYSDQSSKNYRVERDKTKVLVPFGAMYDADALKNYISGLDWEEVKGAQTRTDIALKMANQIFPRRSPLNHRNTADDVIVLITDGEPHGVRNATSKAIAYAQMLKDNGVLIIGVGVGDVQEKAHMDTLKKIASPGYALEATFLNINLILENLAKISCRHQPAEVCPCPPLKMGSQLANPGSTTRDVWWAVPEPNCKSSKQLKSIIPNVNPGESFTIGPHTVQYLYTVHDDEVTCNVSFEVTGTTLCRGKDFSATNQVCCCGSLHEKKSGFKCCGVDYYSTSTHKCCPLFNLRTIQQTCYGPACECPSVAAGVMYVKPGDSRVRVTWNIPQPNCPSSLQTTDPNVKPGETFAVGVHTVKYFYKINDQLVTCEVNFEVKECVCPPTVLSEMQVVPGETMMKVSWSKPQPTCPEVMRAIANPTEQQSGQSFAIGQHTVRHLYNINNQFDIACEVRFEVKGALCLDKGFNVANQVCCCGTVHNMVTGYQCCGQEFYKTSTHKCCPNSVVRRQRVACPTQ